MIQRKKNLPSQSHPNKENQKPYLTKQVQVQLSMEWMYIGNYKLNKDNGKYNVDKWSNIFQKMKKSSAKRLILGTFYNIQEKNDRPTLIKEISNVSFCLLNVLNLSIFVYD